MIEILYIQGHTLLARHSGADTNLLHSLLSQHSGTSVASTTPLASSTATPSAPADASKPRTEEEITARCHELMNKHNVVLFMKGNPSAPKCGFSRQTVGLLREKGVEFAWFDIFSDEEVRQGLKRVNDWPSECIVPCVKSGLISSIPSDHRQWRIGGRTGYCEGDDGERRVGRDGHG